MSSLLVHLKVQHLVHLIMGEIVYVWVPQDTIDTFHQSPCEGVCLLRCHPVQAPGPGLKEESCRLSREPESPKSAPGAPLLGLPWHSKHFRNLAPPLFSRCSLLQA